MDLVIRHPRLVTMYRLVAGNNRCDLSFYWQLPETNMDMSLLWIVSIEWLIIKTGGRKLHYVCKYWVDFIGSRNLLQLRLQRII